MRTASAALSLLLSISITGCIDEDAETGEIAALAPSGSGNVSLEWSIHEGDSLRACSDADASEVAVTFSSADIELSETVECGAGTGETADVPSGEYDVTVSLIDREGGEIATLAMGSQTVHADRTTPLGHIDLILGGGK